MSALSKPLRAKPKAAVQAKRDKFVDDLDVIYNKVLDTTDAYIDPESFENFKIACHHLFLYHGHDGREQANFERYFSPMSVNELQSYPINEDDKDTMEDFRLEYLLWQKDEILGDRPLDAALEMCRMVCGRFDFSRKMNGNETGSLWMRTDWIPREDWCSSFKIMRANCSHYLSDFTKCIFHDVFDDELLHSLKWRPNDAWRARYALSKPHVMFTLIHEYPSEDNKLLRGEVLAILATMLTRLTSNEYRDHTVIPVLALSFMGDKQARLLQAYFGDNGLVIYKSHLLSFKDAEAAEKSIEFLLQFMADELTKIGKVPPVNELEQQAFASGSQITQVQFAALRIIFTRVTNPKKLDDSTLKREYGLFEVWDEAVKLVEKCQGFQAYLLVEREPGRSSTASPFRTRTVARRL